MEMLVGIAHGEGDLDLGKKRHAEALGAVERADVEGQAIRAWRYRTVGQRIDASLFVGCPAAHWHPLTRLPQLEDYRDPLRRLATRDVEDVCGDHDRAPRSGSMSFVRRSCVIRRCSSAATCSSSSASCRKRPERRASISPAVRPVAQTMKM